MTTGTGTGRASWRADAARLQAHGITRAEARAIAQADARDQRRRRQGAPAHDRWAGLRAAANAGRLDRAAIVRAEGIADGATSGLLELYATAPTLALHPWTPQRSTAARARSRAHASPPSARLRRLALVETTLTAAPPAAMGRAGARAAA